MRNGVAYCVGMKTKLKLSTIERHFAAACRAHRQTPTWTINEAHYYLAISFGNCRTIAALTAAIEATF